MKEVFTALGIFASIIVVIAIAKYWTPIMEALNPKGNTDVPSISEEGGYKTSSDTEMTCTLRSAYGNLITLHGNSYDPQFVNMCQNSYPNQRYYVYGYPYFFVRRSHHIGGHHGGGDGGNGGNGGGGEM